LADLAKEKKRKSVLSQKRDEGSEKQSPQRIAIVKSVWFKVGQIFQYKVKFVHLLYLRIFISGGMDVEM